MNCPNCNGTGEIPDPKPEKPESTASKIGGGILFILMVGFLLFCAGGLMRDCGRMHLGGGMCGLIGVESLVPLSAVWLFRKLKQ